MPVQLPTIDFQKLISQICKGYKDNYIKPPFSGELQERLKNIIASIQKIANDDLTTRDKELLEQFRMMKEEINAGFRVYGGIPLKADIEHVEDLRINIDAALKEKQRAANLQQRIVLQQQQLQDAAREENQQLMSSRIQQLERELKELQAQLASLQEKTTAKINSLESELQAASAKNIQLTASLENAEKRALAAEGKVGVANVRVSAAEASAAEAKQKAIELQQIVASQEASLKQVGDGNQQLQVQLEQSKKLAGEIEKEFSSKLSAKDRELESLQARALTAEGKVAAADEKAAVANGRVSEANTRAGQANEKASQAESESLKLRERIDELQGKLRLQDTAFQQLSDENGNLKADNARLASENKTLKQQLEDQRPGLESQQNLTDRVTSQAAELGVLQAKAGKADDRAKAAEKLTEELQRRLDLQTSELGQLRGNNVSLETKLGALESQLTQQDAAFAEQVTAKDAELKELQAKAGAAEQQSTTIEQQRQEIDKLKAEIARLNDAQSVITREKQALADQNTQANLELERLRKALLAASETIEQKDELTQVRGENETLKQNLEGLKSRLAEQGTDLLAKDNLLAVKGEELQALQDRARAAEQQLAMIEQQRKEIEQLTAKVAGLTEAQGISAREQTEQIGKLAAEKTAVVQAQTVLFAENAELKERNLDLEKFRDRNGELIADKAVLIAKVASLGAENERLKKDSAKSDKKQEQQTEQLAALTKKLQQQESQMESLLNQNEQNRNTIASLNEDKAALILQRDILKEKRAQLRQQKEQTTLDIQNSETKEPKVLPAIGLEAAKSPSVQEEIASTTDSTVHPPPAAQTGKLVSVIEARLGDAFSMLEAKQASGSMLKHDYEEGDVAVKSSSYDPKNTENKFKNDGSEEVAALLADSKTIVFEGDPPQKMRYTKDLDKDPTILAGALTLEGISESQPKGGYSVQATMEDCDDHPEFILDVLIKFHERLNKNLMKKSTEELENVHCTTIDYKGDNLMIRNIIDSHNKAAKQINSGELKTKKFQSNQMVEQLRGQKAIVSQALPEDLRRKASDQGKKRSKL